MARFNVWKIVVQWLNDNGYDGLYSVVNECSCSGRSILECNQLDRGCKPGYRAKDGRRVVIVGRKEPTKVRGKKR